MSIRDSNEKRREARRPFLIIGAGQVAGSRHLSLVLDLVAARPERWHPDWIGRYLVQVASNDDSGTVNEWARQHRLECVEAISPKTLAAIRPWGALVVSTDKESIELTEMCLTTDVPCVAYDATEMNIFSLSEKDLAEWVARRYNSHDKASPAQILAADAPAGIIDGTESPFSSDSATIAEGRIHETVITSQDGGRCRFTRSRAEKAG